MNWLERLIHGLYFSRDALDASRNDDATTDEHIALVLGKRPELDPVANLRHAREIKREADNASLREEFAEMLWKAERQASEHLAPTLLGCLLLLCFAGEALGSILVMRSVGLENPERLILGLTLAAFIFFLTHQASHHAPSGSSTSFAPTTKNNWRYLIWGTYGVLALALAVVRLQDMNSGEEGSDFADGAMAIVALASTAGAAWLGEYLMARLQPAMQAAAEVGRLQSRLRTVRREEARAERFLDQTTEASTDWDNEATRRRALHAIRTRRNLRDPEDGSDSERS